MTPATELRLALLDKGYTPLPATGKAVFLRGWPRVPVGKAAVRDWETDPRMANATNTSLRLGPLTEAPHVHLIALDVDVDDAREAAWFRKALDAHLPGALWRVSPSGRPLALFGARAGVRAFPRIAYRTVSGGVVEWLREGQQFVAYGDHPSGGTYEWPNGGPLDTPARALPVVPTRDLRAMLEAVEAEAMDAGLLPADEPRAAVPRSPIRYTLTGREKFDLDDGRRVSYDDARAIIAARGDDYVRASDRCIGGDGHNRRKCVLHLDSDGEITVYNFETGETHMHKRHGPEAVLARMKKATQAVARAAKSAGRKE